MKLRPFNVTSKIPWIHFKCLAANAERIFKVFLTILGYYPADIRLNEDLLRLLEEVFSITILRIPRRLVALYYDKNR